MATSRHCTHEISRYSTAAVPGGLLKPHTACTIGETTGGEVYSMSAIVTSTSTPGSMEMLVICLTISDGECRSIRRLWMRISKRSHVLVPSPQGDLRVVMRSVFV